MAASSADATRVTIEDLSRVLLVNCSKTTLSKCLSNGAGLPVPGARWTHVIGPTLHHQFGMKKSDNEVMIWLLISATSYSPEITAIMPHKLPAKLFPWLETCLFDRAVSVFNTITCPHVLRGQQLAEVRRVFNAYFDQNRPDNKRIHGDVPGPKPMEMAAAAAVPSPAVSFSDSLASNPNFFVSFLDHEEKSMTLVEPSCTVQRLINYFVQFFPGTPDAEVKVSAGHFVLLEPLRTLASYHLAQGTEITVTKWKKLAIVSEAAASSSLAAASNNASSSSLRIVPPSTNVASEPVKRKLNEQGASSSDAKRQAASAASSSSSLAKGDSKISVHVKPKRLLCIICEEREIAFMALPCRHQTICEKCINTIKPGLGCLRCQNPVIGYIDPLLASIPSGVEDVDDDCGGDAVALENTQQKALVPALAAALPTRRESFWIWVDVSRSGLIHHPKLREQLMVNSITTVRGIKAYFQKRFDCFLEHNLLQFKGITLRDEQTMHECGIYIPASTVFLVRN